MFDIDCELIALLEDDTGMELLVCNKIISLDLPVKDVYKKIWCAQPNVSTYNNVAVVAYEQLIKLQALGRFPQVYSIKWGDIYL